MMTVIEKLKAAARNRALYVKTRDAIARLPHDRRLLLRRRSGHREVPVLMLCSAPMIHFRDPPAAGPARRRYDRVGRGGNPMIVWAGSIS